MSDKLRYFITTAVLLNEKEINKIKKCFSNEKDGSTKYIIDMRLFALNIQFEKLDTAKDYKELKRILNKLIKCLKLKKGNYLIEIWDLKENKEVKFNF